jgi:hypothetical protein
LELRVVADRVELDLDVHEVTIELIEATPIELDAGDVEPVVLDVVDGEITLEVIGEVGPRGIQGIQGEIGPPGPPPAFYRHHQTSASDQWLIQHDLPYRPAVTIVDSAGTVLIADVVYVDDLNVQVGFSAPTAGYAYLS